MSPRNRPLNRKTPQRDERALVLIVCEGEKTEKAYFDPICREFWARRNRVRVVGAGKEPLALVEQTIEIAREIDYEQVWCVFDVEAPEPHPRLEAALRLAAKHGFCCAVSHPCFELWLLLHFREHTAYLDNHQVQSLLKSCGCGYSARDKGFEFATVWPKHPDAIARAKALDTRQRADFERLLDRNPWTTVHELVQALMSLRDAGR